MIAKLKAMIRNLKNSMTGKKPTSPNQLRKIKTGVETIVMDDAPLFGIDRDTYMRWRNETHNINATAEPLTVERLEQIRDQVINAAGQPDPDPNLIRVVPGNNTNMTTQAGRMAALDDMFDSGLINAQTYLELLEALDDLTPEEIAEVDRIIRDEE